MLIIKKVEEKNIDDFLDFLKNIARWLNDTGKSMWNIDKLEKDIFLENNKISNCYFGFIDNKPVSSIILTENNDFMWPDLEKNETIFIGKLGVSRDCAGQNLSEEMLNFALEEAKKRNKKYLRLDCYANRKYLCQLYESFGFKLVKKREMMPGLFAALYEMNITK